MHGTLFILAQFADPSMFRAGAASACVGVAGAVLSVFVVLRRWAFLGEGISHAGFGGVGTALLLSIAIPSLNNGAAIYLIATAFAMAMAVGVAWLSRGKAVSGDTAIGVFVAATLGWGFIAFRIHQRLGRGGTGGWEDYLLGDVTRLSLVATLLTAAICASVVLCVVALHRQITFYCFDPILAEVSGVPVAFVHYLLILMVGFVIVVGMRLAGNLLVPALLVLPGAIGLALSQKMSRVMTASIASSVIATLAGVVAATKWNYIPPGPVIALALFAQFLAAHAWRRAVFFKSVGSSE